MSLETVTEIDLDINQPLISVVHAKQYDTVRQVKAHLFYNGVKWEVPSADIFAMVAYKKADRIGGFYDETEDSRTAITVDNDDRSIIYLLLDRNLLTTVGDVNTEVTFYDTIMNGRLTTFSFITQVDAASVTELDLASNPYFAILGEEIHDVLEAQAAMTGVEATAVKVAPGGAVTPIPVTGGPGTGDPYNFEFKIPTFAGLDVNGTVDKVKPGGTPVVQISGGTTGEEKYTLKFKIPVFPGINSPATVNTLTPGSSATATISGGTTGTDKYSFTFGIPQGEKGDKPVPTSTQYRYATTTVYTAPPAASASSWSSTPNPQPGKYIWCEATTTWDNGQTTVDYNVSHIGANGTGSTAAEITTNSALTVQEELDYKILVKDIVSLSSLPYTVNDSSITADHIVVEAVLGDPSVMINDWTATTSTGKVVISGSISGTTSLRLVLAKATIL